MMPIVHPRFKREFLSGKAKDRSGPFTRSDLLLQSTGTSDLSHSIFSVIEMKCH